MRETFEYFPRRRDILLAAAAVSLVGLDGAGAPARASTPACRATPDNEEGPFFKPVSPRRLSLVRVGMPGVRLSLTGVVRSTACRPIQGVLLDFWQADANGHYDNRGFRLRGHQYSDEAGRYRLETIVPGFYPGRTRHIHVKLRRPGGRLLTTELYFPREPRNAADGSFTTALVIDVTGRADGHRSARFDFVLR